MLKQTQRATLEVRVPRGAAGDVEGGVRGVVTDVDGVEAVDVHELTGVRPDALDLYVECEVTVDVANAVEAPAERLRAGFGVVAADLG